MHINITYTDVDKCHDFKDIVWVFDVGLYEVLIGSQALTAIRRILAT